MHDEERRRECDSAADAASLLSGKVEATQLRRQQLVATLEKRTKLTDSMRAATDADDYELADVNSIMTELKRMPAKEALEEQLRAAIATEEAEKEALNKANEVTSPSHSLSYAQIACSPKLNNITLTLASLWFISRWVCNSLTHIHNNSHPPTFPRCTSKVHGALLRHKDRMEFFRSLSSVELEEKYEHMQREIKYEARKTTEEVMQCKADVAMCECVLAGNAIQEVSLSDFAHRGDAPP